MSKKQTDEAIATATMEAVNNLYQTLGLTNPFWVLTPKNEPCKGIVYWGMASDGQAMTISEGHREENEYEVNGPFKTPHEAEAFITEWRKKYPVPIKEENHGRKNMCANSNGQARTSASPAKDTSSPVGTAA